MTRFIVLILLIFTGLKTKAQRLIDCNDIRYGKYMIKDEQSGTTIINRIDDIQREENTKFGVITEDSIKWINACKYKLVPYRVLKNESAMDFGKDLQLVIEITEIKEKSYTQITTSMLTGESIKCEVIILDKQ